MKQPVKVIMPRAFKSTNHFLKKVFKCEVTDIDIKNYVYMITLEHDPQHLFTLERDIIQFMCIAEDELFYSITPEDWKKRIEHYESKGIKIPTKIHRHIINEKLNQRNKNKDLTEVYTMYDVEAIHYPYDLFCIRKLRNYVKSLIENIGKKESEEPSDPKHEKIFCNNGFVLFDHILNEYVKTDRGRLSDIHFFYRSMYENDPQYIHQPPERFKEWFNSEYDEDLGKIKTYNQVNDPDRRKHYSHALEWFKTQF